MTMQAKLPEIYIAVDVETDGPIPCPYSPGFGGNGRAHRAPSPLMSASGQERTLAAIDFMSALPPKPDVKPSMPAFGVTMDGICGCR